MKDLSFLILEEINMGTGAAVGASVGAAGAAGIWAYKRLQLQKKMNKNF